MEGRYTAIPLSRLLPEKAHASVPSTNETSTTVGKADYLLTMGNPMVLSSCYLKRITYTWAVLYLSIFIPNPLSSLLPLRSDLTMRSNSLLVTAAAAVVPVLASYLPVPSLSVPACPAKSSVKYDRSVPDKDAFPPTQVDLCYDDSAIQLTFTANDEVNFFYNASQTTNDGIWAYEVMEAFIYQGTNDPTTYLEFEVSPNNVTFNAFIYNPTKVRAAGTLMDTAFWGAPIVDGLTAETFLDREAKTWTSAVWVLLGFFNVDKGQARGTKWRMNFFRTITNATMFPDQLLGAWSPTNQSNFHMTPFFGHVLFV